MTRHAAASSQNTRRDRDGADTMVESISEAALRGNVGRPLAPPSASGRKGAAVDSTHASSSDTPVQYPYRLPTRTPERYTCARPDCNAPAVEVWVYGGACKGVSFLGECAKHRRPHESPEPRPKPGEPLTDAEIAVLALVAEGWTWDRIAREFDLSDRTVRRRLGDAQTKLGGNGRINTVARAVAQGLVTVNGGTS